MNKVSEKVKSDAAIKRLKRRMGVAKVSSYITPFPVSNFIPSIPPDGVIMRYMFPGAGTISNSIMYAEGELKKGAEIRAEIKSITDVVVGAGMTIRKNFGQLGLDQQVNAGDRLIISLTSEVEITNIWVAFLWLPKVKETEVMSFLQAELAQLTEEE